MASGRSTTRGAERRFVFAALAFALAAGATAVRAQAACDKPVYLTFDTGHMEVAPLVADVLRRHDVKVTFFAANERTKAGDGSLGAHWAPWWKARAEEGHEFASHTFNHVYWRADLGDDGKRFKVRASAGPDADRDRAWTAAQYCQEIERAALRLREVTGKPTLPLFRAPGGRTSPKFLAAVRACGWEHVGWSPAGFLGDELPSETVSNQVLLERALRGIRAGDILVAHLGIWSRRDPWAPSVLEPLVVGLRQRGFCFRTLREHPRFASWISQREGPRK